MAMLKPFAALRPKPDLAARICELPYDVLSSEEARRIAAGNPLSFLRVSKPEIDLPAGTPLHSDRVYEKGAQNFRKLVADGALRPDAQPHFYLYRQVMAAHSQTGIVAAASCAEYLDGSIKKHEFTRPDKEDDRVRHIEGLGAQTGPAFLVYRPVPALNQLIAAKIQSVPDVDFTAADGVRHSSWTIGDAKEMGFVAQQFAHIPSLYIADGHHRSAAAARIFQSRKGAARSGQFLAVIFSADEVRILPYNRALADLNGNSPRQLLEKLEAVFTIARAGAAVPGRKHEVGFYFQGRWRTLAFRR
ncbi:MAG: DUF1015 family protein, partial [Verrucomicrobia bacterium]|nr:DUF1015 family protein [Verrucomicrobiota bacterium]